MYLCLYTDCVACAHVIERRARPDTRPALFSSQQPTPDHLSLSQYVNSGTKTPCIERHNVRPCLERHMHARCDDVCAGEKRRLILIDRIHEYQCLINGAEDRRTEKFMQTRC
jgi:hypothetical protein